MSVKVKINKKTFEVTVEVSGVAGPSCQQITDQLKKLGEVSNEGNTPDFYLPEMQTEENLV